MIYLIEDSATDAMLVEDGLSKHGVKIIHFATAQEFLEEAKFPEGGKHLVIVDIVMPEMDGIELLRAMGRMHLADTSVVIASSFGLEHLQVAAKLASGWGLDVAETMDKPIDIEKLARLADGCS